MTDTWDEEEGNQPSLTLDWVTVEGMAAADPAVAQLSSDIGAEFAAGDTA